MDNARDLARVDPWQQSAERSRARRRRAEPPSPKPEPARTHRRRRGRAERARRESGDGGRALADRLASLQVWWERILATRSVLPTPGPKGVAGLALLAAIVASSLGSGGPQNAPSAARADAPRAVFASAAAGPQGTLSGNGAAGLNSCPLAVAPQGYANPLAGAVVKPERIDQGVDYAGSGTLSAIGTGRITYLATSGTGWPGAFIEYQLLDGADAGCFVFYAEGVVPADGLRVGDTVTAGQPLATIIPKYPSGIEIGWGAGRGTKAYAKVAGQWSPADDHDNVATAAGKNFSALIAALGGPPGIVEG